MKNEGKGKWKEWDLEWMGKYEGKREQRAGWSDGRGGNAMRLSKKEKEKYDDV
jgi:hypothetical protein